MKIDYLPTEDDKTYMMFAYYDEQNNEVIWNGCTNSENYYAHFLGTEHTQFLVWRRGSTVIVEACGWYSSGFHYRFELTELPDRVVILAAHAAALYDRAHDEESPI